MERGPAPPKTRARDPDTEDDEDLRSRSDIRRERKESEEALMRLARALVALPERTLGRVSLPENIADVVARARAVPDGGPRNRALRLVRMALRDSDAAKIEAALRDVHEPPRAGAPPDASAASGAADQVAPWREKLVGGGDEALAAFVAVFPDADRRKLRQLVRNVHKASEGRRSIAVAALDRAISESLDR